MSDNAPQKMSHQHSILYYWQIQYRRSDVCVHAGLKTPESNVAIQHKCNRIQHWILFHSLPSSLADIQYCIDAATVCSSYCIYKCVYMCINFCQAVFLWPLLSNQKKKKKSPQLRWVLSALGQSCCVFYRKLHLACGGLQVRGGVWSNHLFLLFLTIYHGRLMILICDSD